MFKKLSHILNRISNFKKCYNIINTANIQSLMILKVLCHQLLASSKVLVNIILVIISNSKRGLKRERGKEIKNIIVKGIVITEAVKNIPIQKF